MHHPLAGTGHTESEQPEPPLPPPPVPPPTPPPAPPSEDGSHASFWEEPKQEKRKQMAEGWSQWTEAEGWKPWQGWQPDDAWTPHHHPHREGGKWVKKPAVDEWGKWEKMASGEPVWRWSWQG